MRRLFVGFAAAVAVAASGSAMAADLTASEIRNELVGQTINWRETQGFNAGEIVLEPGGAARLLVARPRPEADIGRWSFDGDRLCTVWTSLREGERKCYAVRRDGPGRYVTSGGNVFEVPFAGA